MTEPTDAEVQDGRLEVLEAKDRNWYPIAVAVATSLLSTVLLVGLVLVATHGAAKRSREQQRQIIATAEVQHQALCALIISLDDNAHADPPETDLGRSNARTYAMLRVTQGCPPRERT